MSTNSFGSVKIKNILTAPSIISSSGGLSIAPSNGILTITGAITGLTSPLTVAQGGTGQATLAANNVLIGNGTSGVSTIALGASGTALISTGVSTAPTFQSIPSSSTAWFGDGSDGVWTLTGSSSQTLPSDKYYSAINFTVASGQTITVDMSGFRLFCNGTVTLTFTGNAGSIVFRCNGGNANGTSLGTGAASGFYPINLDGQNGRVAGSAGFTSSAQTNSVGGQGGRGASAFDGVTTFTNGAAGAVTAPSATAGGAKVHTFIYGIMSGRDLSATRWNTGTAGGGGACATSGFSGGSGGAGGVCFAAFKRLTISGTPTNLKFTADGGKGGDGTPGTTNYACGAGGGGGGGVAILVLGNTDITTANFTQFSANGGLPGTSFAAGTGSNPVAAAAGSNGTAMIIYV